MSPPPPASPERDDPEILAVSYLIERLRHQFAGHEDIAGRAARAYAAYDGARVRQFVPILVERAVVAELRGKAPVD